MLEHRARYRKFVVFGTVCTVLVTTVVVTYANQPIAGGSGVRTRQSARGFVPPPSAGFGAVDLTPDNNWSGKLPNGTPVDVYSVRAADSAGTVHYYTPAGKPMKEVGVSLPKPSNLAAGEYEIVVRVHGKEPIGLDKFLGETREVGREPTTGQGQLVLIEGLTGSSASTSDDAMTEDGLFVAYPNDDARIADDVTLVSRQPVDDVIAEVNVKSQEITMVQQTDAKLSFIPDVSKVHTPWLGGRPGFGIEVKTSSDTGSIEVRGKCEDGEVVHGRNLSGPFGDQVSGVYGMLVDWNVKYIQVIRHAWQTLKIEGIKLVRPKASA